jgi:hypothetical protein
MLASALYDLTLTATTAVNDMFVLDTGLLSDTISY